MAGLMVPVVIFPRFTGLIGNTIFNSLALDVSPYYELRLSLWRGPLVGTTPNFGASVQDSTDRDSWNGVPGGNDLDPGQNVEVEYVLPISKRWLRISVALTGGSPGTTFWATGFLIKRER